MKASAVVERHDSTVINHFSGPSLVPFLYSVLAVLQIRFVRLRVRHDSLVRSVCACLCDGEREKERNRGGGAKGGRVPGCAQCSSGPLPDVSAMPLHIGLALTVTHPQSRHTEICHPARRSQSLPPCQCPYLPRRPPQHPCQRSDRFADILSRSGSDLDAKAEQEGASSELQHRCA